VTDEPQQNPKAVVNNGRFNVPEKLEEFDAQLYATLTRAGPTRSTAPFWQSREPAGIWTRIVSTGGWVTALILVSGWHDGYPARGGTRLPGTADPLFSRCHGGGRAGPAVDGSR